MITLANGALSLGIMAECGASITHFRDGDFAVLRESPGPALARLDGREFSAFPLIPYSNRIRNGQFSFGGRDYTLAHDTEDQRHSLHGTSRFQPWRVERQTAAAARCVFEYQPLPDDWPFAYTAWQGFTLLEDRLRVEIGLQSTHHSAAPAGIGLHPYFTRHGEAILEFAAGYVWAKDAEDIPIRTEADAGKFDFSRPRAVELEELIDHAYGGWNGDAEIAYQQLERGVQLRAAKAFRNLVVFTPEDKDYFAIEPVSHRPDAVNPNGDPRDAGMDILQPGETLTGVVEIILI